MAMLLLASAGLAAPTGQQEQEFALVQPDRLHPKICPAASPAKGLLYNHVSKTGGTTMKAMLEAATGASRSKNANVTYIKDQEHVSGDDHRIGPDGALIIEEDVYHDLAVSEADAASFFTVGVVRRPCDFLVSTWAWDSDNRRRRNGGTATDTPHSVWSITSSNDAPEDHGKFERWLSNTIMHREKGHGSKEGNMLMSAALASRYDDADRDVHCWVRTHAMVDDLKRCMEQYEQCGGTYVREALSGARVGEIHMKVDARIVPSQYGKCSTYFNSTAMASVMQSEHSLVTKYQLGSCCSD